VAIELEYPPGATPLDPDEAAGLIPSHIATQGQLNEWELANILEGERWAFVRSGVPRVARAKRPECTARASTFRATARS